MVDAGSRVVVEGDAAVIDGGGVRAVEGADTDVYVLEVRVVGGVGHKDVFVLELVADDGGAGGILDGEADNRVVVVDDHGIEGKAVAGEGSLCDLVPDLEADGDFLNGVTLCGRYGLAGQESWEGVVGFLFCKGAGVEADHGVVVAPLPELGGVGEVRRVKEGVGEHGAVDGFADVDPPVAVDVGTAEVDLDKTKGGGIAHQGAEGNAGQEAGGHANGLGEGGFRQGWKVVLGYGMRYTEAVLNRIAGRQWIWFLACEDNGSSEGVLLGTGNGVHFGITIVVEVLAVGLGGDYKGISNAFPYHGIGGDFACVVHTEGDAEAAAFFEVAAWLLAVGAGLGEEVNAAVGTGDEEIEVGAGCSPCLDVDEGRQEGLLKVDGPEVNLKLATGIGDGGA